ncbi:MAG: glycoside hydrolase family 127 protein [Verrucomicrobiae bacterium]|nr:glycoside hydrolase family 127 protein [Verrucomicrobiae bacterium]
MKHVLPITSLLVAFSAFGADLLTPLDLREVKVGGEVGRRITVTVTNNLLKLDADKDFLRPFTEKPRTGRFIGLGMLLDSVVKLAAHTGDARVLALKKHLVTKICEAQEADGYIGTFEPPQRITSLWDVHEMGYIIWGLLEDHRYFGEPASLAAARKAADYLVKNWSVLPPDWGRDAEVAPHVAFTGIERTMLALHRATGDPAYLRFVTETRALPDWDLGIVIGRRPGIEGHVYAYMARCLAQLELYRLRPSARLLRATQRALDFMTRKDGMLITGSCGQCEIWTDDQDGRGDVGETCALAYQLRVFDSLLRLRGDSRMGDLMERVIFNALFASQSPDGRRLRYFAPLEGNRVYWTTDTYCCPCNFRRIIAELPVFVFYRANDGITVNLYTPAHAKCGAVEIRQETDYPNSGRVHIRLAPEKPAVFSLRLRIPSWAPKASVVVNGQSASGVARPGSFLEIRRRWKAGDEVLLDMPMQWRLVKGRQRQAGRVAVMRGPQVFCLDPLQEPALAKLDGVDLGYLALNPDSLGEPVRNAVVRPDGMGCRVQMWKPGFGLGKKADHELTLTEFPDPNGRATYFRLRDYGVAVADELLCRQ